MLKNIRIVLVETSHSGNIGSAARAMKTMGLQHLYLVAPKQGIDEQAIALAAGAEDVVKNAVITESFVQAISDCHLVIGSSARLRHLQSTIIEPRECGEKVIQQAEQGKIAIVFGRERVGLTNDELLQCQYHLTIPANPEYSSLNLAMAVQLISYEIRQAWLQHSNKEITLAATGDNYPTAQQLDYFFSQMEDCYRQLGFIKNQAVMQKLKRLYNRSKIEKNELNILLGMLTSVKNLLNKDNAKVD